VQVKPFEAVTRPSRLSEAAAPGPDERHAKRLDFVVIGAAKCGTTTLFDLLRSHPDVWLPAAKEVPFLYDDTYSSDWASVRARWFAGAPTDLRWGTVTPQYLMDPDRVAPRLSECAPGAQLIAILRNPIDRALSHQRMARRLGEDMRPLEDALTEELNAMESASRQATASRTASVRLGEYARLLEPYLAWFGLDRLHVMFLEDLQASPIETVAALYRVLRIRDLSTTASVPHAHEGGDRYRWPALQAMRHNRLLQRGWHRVPTSFRDWAKPTIDGLERWNTVKSTPNLNPELRKRLADFYKPDVARLADLLGRQLPWSDW